MWARIANPRYRVCFDIDCGHGLQIRAIGFCFDIDCGHGLQIRAIWLSGVAVDKIPGINKVTKEVVKTATEATVETAKKVIKKE